MGIDFSFPQNPLLAKHVNLVPLGGASQPLIITLNQLLEWEVDEVFADGFESGTTDGWSETVP